MPSVMRSRKTPDDPRELARKLVGAEEEHLHHVEQDDRDHEVRAPAVQRAQEPAERLLVVEALEAAPRLVGRRHVDERQADAGHDLQDEQRPALALPNTYAPARGVARARDASAASRIGAASCRRSSNQSSDRAGSGARRSRARRPRDRCRHATLVPSVGISPPRIQSSAVLDLVVVLEQPARRRARGARAVARSRRRRGTGT